MKYYEKTSFGRSFLFCLSWWRKVKISVNINKLNVFQIFIIIEENKTN